MNKEYQQGYDDACRGHEATSDDYDYLLGYVDGEESLYEFGYL